MIARSCAICGTIFFGRKNAQTCSAQCRVERGRINARARSVSLRTTPDGKAKLRVSQAKYRDKHRDRMKTYLRNYHEQNREKYVEYGRKQRARDRAILIAVRELGLIKTKDLKC